MRIEEIAVEEFRNVLDENSLERGFYYFKNGWVKSLKETTGKFYEARVHGSDENLVVFHLEQDKISEYFCTCHYTFGKPCRHLAAVLFLMEEDRKKTEYSEEFKRIVLKK